MLDTTFRSGELFLILAWIKGPFRVDVGDLGWTWGFLVSLSIVPDKGPMSINFLGKY